MKLKQTLMTAKIEQITQQVVERLHTEHEPLKIMLFGSYSNDNADPESDLDFLIIKDTNERFIDRWVTVRRILFDPSRKIPIETLVLMPKEISNRLSSCDKFIAEIIENDKVLYAS
jgi:predicted nucleotidyltransferase